jgi:adenine C2-methylase RlmN of 23S rRNA A2503 and tRNA A37
MKKEMNLYLEEMPDEALLDYVTEKTGQKFRFNQLKRYLIQGVPAIDDMTSLPASLREQLKQDFKFGTVIIVIIRSAPLRLCQRITKAIGFFLAHL